MRYRMIVPAALALSLAGSAALAQQAPAVGANPGPGAGLPTVGAQGPSEALLQGNNPALNPALDPLLQNPFVVNPFNPFGVPGGLTNQFGSSQFIATPGFGGTGFFSPLGGGVFAFPGGAGYGGGTVVVPVPVTGGLSVIGLNTPATAMPRQRARVRFTVQANPAVDTTALRNAGRFEDAAIHEDYATRAAVERTRVVRTNGTRSVRR